MNRHGLILDSCRIARFVGNRLRRSVPTGFEVGVAAFVVVCVARLPLFVDHATMRPPGFARVAGLGRTGRVVIQIAGGIAMFRLFFCFGHALDGRSRLGRCKTPSYSLYSHHVLGVSQTVTAARFVAP